MPVGYCVVLIDSLGCPTITHKVLCTSCNIFLSTKIWNSFPRTSRKIPLQTKYNLSHVDHNFGILTVAFITSTPPWISADCNTWSKYIRNPCGSNLKSSCNTYPLYQIRISGSSKPNIVREYRCIIDIVMAMYCINPIYHRNSQTARQ
uniref:Uncharacterized protein n=1 Tax=Rhizophora mucronata TaxID=61149 RepID=A0A2P2LKT9_RHIMU